VPNAEVSDSKSSTFKASTSQISWLALTLTPGLGPTRAKRLVEFFGSVESVFNATLTELEAAGLPAQSAQSLGTGRSVELAHDEIAKAAVAGVQLWRLTMRSIHRAFDRYTIRLWCFTFAGTLPCFRSPALRWLERGILLPMGWEWRSGWRVIWLPVG